MRPIGERMTAALNFMVSVTRGDQSDFMFPGKMQISTADDGGFTVPVRGGSGTGAVTYKSSNDNIASVRHVPSVNGDADANNDGEITIYAPGSITITATKAADANYKRATATFELLVVTVVIPDGAEARDVKSEDDDPATAAAADETGEALAVDNVGNDDNDLRLFLPVLPRATTLTIGTYDLSADDTPARVAFSGVTMDIASTDEELDDPATVCLSTAGVPENRDPLLYHLADPASPWQEIGSDTTTREDFVCGPTDTFSPFAVGYYISPRFDISSDMAIGDQFYTVGILIDPLPLPEAKDGAFPLAYTLTPIPDGLDFDPVERMLTGTPTTVSEAVSLTYTVTDSNSSPAMASVTFDVTIMSDINTIAPPERANPDARIPGDDRQYAGGGSPAGGSGG